MWKNTLDFPSLLEFSKSCLRVEGKIIPVCAVLLKCVEEMLKTDINGRVKAGKFPTLPHGVKHHASTSGKL